MVMMHAAHIAGVMSPFHSHDSYDDCVFLGQQASAGSKYDFWLADEESEEVLLIRFDSEPHCVAAYPTTVDWKAMGFAPTHAIHVALEVLSQYEKGKWMALEVTPHSERTEEEEESDWKVGLYHDVWVKETDRNIFLRDSDGGPLGIAKKNAVAGRNSDAPENDGFLFRAEGSLDGVEAGYLDKVLGTKKQVFLWAMLLKQMSVDSGQ